MPCIVGDLVIATTVSMQSIAAIANVDGSNRRHYANIVFAQKSGAHTLCMRASPIRRMFKRNQRTRLADWIGADSI